eukprot:scaffold1411_cov396-Prasinococcus_capsulatus_cf.AAC.7
MHCRACSWPAICVHKNPTQSNLFQTTVLPPRSWCHETLVPMALDIHTREDIAATKTRTP